MLNGLRVTLALRFVLPDREVVSLLDDLLKSLKKQGFQIACLFLDKGFASIAVMDYLTRRAQPALIACPIRGKTGGTRALCQGRQSYRTTHTFVSGDQTFTATHGGVPEFHHGQTHQAVEATRGLVALHLDRTRPLATPGAPLVSETVWHREQLPLCGSSAGLDDLAQSRLSLCADHVEFRAAQCLGAFALVVCSSAAPWSALAQDETVSTAPHGQVYAPCFGTTVWRHRNDSSRGGTATMKFGSTESKCLLMRSRTALFGVTDLLLLATVCVWAVNFIAVKNVISGSLQPIAFTALRFGVASIVLLPLLRGLTPAKRAVSSSDRWRIGGLGLIGNLTVSDLLHHRVGEYVDGRMLRGSWRYAADLHCLVRRVVQAGKTDVTGQGRSTSRVSCSRQDDPPS